MNKDVLIEKLFHEVSKLNGGRLSGDLTADFFEWMVDKDVESKKEPTESNTATGILWKSLDDGIYRWEDYTGRNTDKMYHELAKYYAFDDYDQCEVPFAIYDNGHPIEYCGWEPHMVIRFKDMFTDEDVYECQHMEWEH